MRKQHGDFEAWFGLVVVVLLLLGYFIGSPIVCASRWDGSGMKADWGPIKGCMVQTKEGRWIPEDRVREIDLGERK